MGWDYSRPIDPLGPPGPVGPERCETIELVGPHLRVIGEISLLRFNRLSDLMNHSRGFVKLSDAQLLRRNGDPTNLVVPELMVNQDEITFVAQKEEHIAEPVADNFGPMDRPLMRRVPRELVIFTDGHTLTGTSTCSPRRTSRRSSTARTRASCRSRTCWLAPWRTGA